MYGEREGGEDKDEESDLTGVEKRRTAAEHLRLRGASMKYVHKTMDPFTSARKLP